MSDRRQFLGAIAAAGAASLVNPGDVSATPSAFRQQKWDMTWLAAVKAKAHKQVYDMGTLDTGGVTPLHFPHFWMEANKEVYGSTDAQMTAIVGIAGNAFPMAFKDALWAKYPLGEHWKVDDPKTKVASKRNVFADPAETGMTAPFMIAALQKRGVIVWMCNNALSLVSGMMADNTKQKHDVVYNEFKAGLLPGVKVVVSHTMMLGACQENGCSYQRV
jgi:hypothetical protein